MTLEDIKEKIQYGDYITLGKMFNLPTATVKSRFLRGNEKAAEAMTKIIIAREKVIEEFRQQLIEEFKEFIN
ncbi:hypothetical protein ACFX5E_11715 [Flavobacterium sp. LS2P90]|uniref:HTH psq-type domain-containing protein n=1 Tax=Flavobacterium xylosi TaxID=3230415 RepID=A0ABW6HYC4_9FLAO